VNYGPAENLNRTCQFCKGRVAILMCLVITAAFWLFEIVWKGYVRHEEYDTKCFYN